MLRLGLTGGIGSGKSTVANRLAEHGAVIIDADAIAREVVASGTAGLAELVAAFGRDILDGDTLNRSALASKAFRNEESRAVLNNITHPRIAARTAELLAEASVDAVVVHDVPLLVENNLAPHYHLTAVVGAPEDVRLRRLLRFRGLKEADARARISAQASDEQRREVADVWLDNSGTPDLVLAMADQLWADRLVPMEANLRLRRPALPDMTVRSYDQWWPNQAKRLISRIRYATGSVLKRITHVGPTSVPGQRSANILDFVAEVAAESTVDDISSGLADAGFVSATPASGAVVAELPLNQLIARMQPLDTRAAVPYVSADPKQSAVVWIKPTLAEVRN